MTSLGGGWSWAKGLNFWGFRRAQIIHLSNQIIYQIRNLLKWLQDDFPGRMGLGAKHLKFFSVLPPSSVQFMEKNQDFLGFALAPPPDHSGGQFKVSRCIYKCKLYLHLNFFSVLPSHPPLAIYWQGCKPEQGYILYKFYLFIKSGTCKSDFKVTSLGGWA